MNSFVSLLILAIAVVTQADRTVSGILSTDIAIAGSADGTVTINFGLLGTPPSLIVTSSGATNIRVDAVASGSLGLTLPASQGITALGLTLSATAYVALDITSSNSSASVTLQLVTPSLTALFTASTQVAGIFYADGSAYVNIPSTTSNGQLTANLPGVGTYVFVSIDKTLQVGYSPNIAPIIAGANRTYQFASNFAIQVLTQTSNSLTVAASNTTASGTVAARAAIGLDMGVYFTIDLSTTTAAHVSTLQYTYTTALLEAKGLAASAATGLKWAYYDTVNAVWTLAAQASTVDVNAQVVAQVTTHFSEWGVFYASSSFKLLMSFTVYLFVATLLLSMV